MRLWSIHPSYLDSIGLVALWCENLAAKKVLEGKTKGYIHHPQWVRFRITKYPVAAINYHLLKNFEEAETKGLSFDRKKIQ